MRLINIIFVISLPWIGAFGQIPDLERKYVQPKEITGVYKNHIREVYEKPIFIVNPEDRLFIIDIKNGYFKIQNAAGQSGWIEKGFLTAIGKSRTIRFANTEVIGYLDNPMPVYIVDSDDPDAERIYLDRQFKDALRDNTDKETIERQLHK
jgi:hypothetical protein